MAWSIERRGTVAVVSMSSHKVNIQNEQFFGDLEEAFARLEHEFSDCAVVLRSEARAFSAGLDFNEAFVVMRSDPTTLAAWAARYIATNRRIWNYPRPTVAAVHGPAIAGGFLTAIDCDFRIASDDAQFCLNEVPIGIAFPYVYVEIIRSALHEQAASRLMLFGETIDATTARELGVVMEVTTKDQLLERAIAIAERIPPSCFEAYAHTKRMLRLAAEERIARHAQSEDAALFAALLSPRSQAARAARAAAVMPIRL